MALAYVRVNAGVTSIVAANITDKRQDGTVCGVANNLMAAETDTLFLQFQAAMADYQATAEAEFDTWFATIQGALDGDTAGNLLNLINTHKADKNNPHDVTAAQVGAAIPPVKVTMLSAGAVQVADNTIYVFTGVTVMAVTYPVGDFECLMDISTGLAPVITFPAGTVYLGGPVTYAASKRYEISIRNGIVCAAEVKAS
jgi:hypothetical protein